MAEVVSSCALPVEGMLAVNWATWEVRGLVGYYFRQMSNGDVLKYGVCSNGEFLTPSLYDDAAEEDSWVFIPKRFSIKTPGISFLTNLIIQELEQKRETYEGIDDAVRKLARRVLVESLI